MVIMVSLFSKFQVPLFVRERPLPMLVSRLGPSQMLSVPFKLIHVDAPQSRLGSLKKCLVVIQLHVLSHNFVEFEAEMK